MGRGGEEGGLQMLSARLCAVTYTVPFCHLIHFFTPTPSLFCCFLSLMLLFFLSIVLKYT